MANTPDSLPDATDPGGPCPWCGRVSSFNVNDVGYLSDEGLNSATTRRLHVLRCQGCRRSTVVVSDLYSHGLFWWPTPGAGNLDAEVDARVASAYDEGTRCLSIGANRAAAVMFRSALTLFIKDKGGEKAKEERHLKTALKYMKNDGDLHRSLWDWADHLNQLGNEGAHPEDYDDITVDEAAGLGKFVHQLIEIEYEMPARLLRAQGLLHDKESAEVDQRPGASGADFRGGGGEVRRGELDG